MTRLRVALPAALLAAAALACAGPAASAPVVRVVTAPLADHHQYLYSPAAAAFMSSNAALRPISAQDLIAQLDAAGIGRAAVLSVAYVYGLPESAHEEEYVRVRAENDWAARQAAQFPQRLVALCSVDPLKDYALAEVARCAANPEFGRAVKLHLGAGGIRLDDREGIDHVQRVFRSANARGMAIVLQLRGTGAQQARMLIEQLLPYAPEVPVQVAYSGAGDTAAPLAGLGVLADAAARRDPRMRQVWFDVSAFARPGMSPGDARQFVRRLRQVGMGRVLYGSDAVAGADLPPRDAWAAFRSLPLTDAEAARVAGNVMNYLR